MLPAPSSTIEVPKERFMSSLVRFLASDEAENHLSSGGEVALRVGKGNHPPKVLICPISTSDGLDGLQSYSRGDLKASRNDFLGLAPFILNDKGGKAIGHATLIDDADRQRDSSLAVASSTRRALSRVAVSRGVSPVSTELAGQSNMELAASIDKYSSRIDELESMIAKLKGERAERVRALMANVSKLIR